MGAKITRLSNLKDQDHDTPDCATGLSHREIQFVQQSWAQVYSNAEGNGQELFKRLFRMDPDSKTVHKTYRHLDEEQLSKSAQFRANVIIFMNNVNMVLNHLHQPEVATALLNNIGDSVRHFPKKHFETLEKVAHDFLLKEQKASDSVLRSWCKVMQFMHQNLQKSQAKS